MMEELAGVDADPKAVMIDATYPEAHGTASVGKKGNPGSAARNESVGYNKRRYW